MGTFCEHDQAFVRRLVEGGVDVRTIYDIGASNGMWSHLIAQIVPQAKFELFEPQQGGAYQQSMQGLLAEHPNFRLHPVALGRWNRKARLWLRDDQFSSSLIGGRRRPVTGSVTVPVRRLDAFTVEADLPPADLMKMDVQGGELRILKGARRSISLASALIIESWLYRGYGPRTPLLSDITQWLKRRDFILAGFGETCISPNGMLTHVDAYFLRRDVAARLSTQTVDIAA